VRTLIVSLAVVFIGETPTSEQREGLSPLALYDWLRKPFPARSGPGASVEAES